MDRKEKGRMRDLRWRGRRPGKIAGSAAEGAVRACLERGGTLREAAGIFRDITGGSVSLDSVSRYYQRMRAEAEERRRRAEVNGN